MWPALQAFRLRDAIDILLVSLVFYRVFVMLKGRVVYDATSERFHADGPEVRTRYLTL